MKDKEDRVQTGRYTHKGVVSIFHVEGSGKSFHSSQYFTLV